MTDDLHSLLLEYDREHDGRTGLDLHGKVFLDSELSWVSRYFAEKEGEDEAHVSLSELPAFKWAGFCLYLYRDKEFREDEIGRIYQRCLKFLQWAEEKLSPEWPGMGAVVGALKLGHKECKRLFRIHRHLHEVMRSRIYQPGPMDTPEEIDLQMEAVESQNPPVIQEVDDEYVVKARNKKLRLVFLEGRMSRSTYVFRADPKFISLLQNADVLRLRLGLMEDGTYRLVGYDMPITDIAQPFADDEGGI